jgi:hypothetical protein
LHCGHDLQIEYVSAGDGSTLQQSHPPATARAGVGNTCRPGSASIVEMMLNASVEEQANASLRGLVMTE